MSNSDDVLVRSTELCLPPFESSEPPAFLIPVGACDTHAHVVRAVSNDRFVPDRSYTPNPAPENQYLGMLNRNGMTRGVIVQISVYGTDNSYMCEVLERHPNTLRGVAVVEADVSDAELKRLHQSGVRGARLNVLFGGGIGFDSMERLAAKIAPLGWHMEFLMDIRRLPELWPRMRTLPCPVVIDHMGHMPVASGVSDPALDALCEALSQHNWWCKLSGPYRISNQLDNYQDVTPWAQSLIAAAPDKIVWGSDWPHVALPTMVDTGRMLNQLAVWAPDEAQRNKILVDNPARLYDFSAL